MKCALCHRDVVTKRDLVISVIAKSFFVIPGFVILWMNAPHWVSFVVFLLYPTPYDKCGVRQYP